jgi:predicted RNA binding protein YcfA (HicA-like mRNA interferase family)
VTNGLPLVSGQETVKALGRLGFERVSQRGSHVKLRNSEGRTAIVPLHSELARGTLRSILRQAGIDPEDFGNAL